MIFQKLRTDLRKKLSLVKLLLINADGFLTENQTPYSQTPSLSEGQEIRALKRVGVRSVAFSTKELEALYTILSRLGIDSMYQDVSQKSVTYSKLKVQHSVSDNEIAFIGWDFSDLPIIERVNFSVAPADAPLEIKAKSYYVTYGVGEESVREVARLILRAKNPDRLFKLLGA
jgi:3-deoxy-D-manno-octulosonate 8-phosphate phosphatase (KDO 8-P phosphatase)